MLINFFGNNEIDESNREEVWLLGVLESEYSNLSIFIALIDLLRVGT